MFVGSMALFFVHAAPLESSVFGRIIEDLRAAWFCGQAGCRSPLVAALGLAVLWVLFLRARWRASGVSALRVSFFGAARFAFNCAANSSFQRTGKKPPSAEFKR